MRYRVMMSVQVDARDDREAQAYALKLKELLKNPFVRMQLEAEGIRLAGDDGLLVVHQPVREFV